MEDRKNEFDHELEIVPLAKELCKRDGNESEANFGQMLEHCANFADLFYEDLDAVASMCRYGKARNAEKFSTITEKCQDPVKPTEDYGSDT